jgi:hypothetical protein
MSQLTSPIIFVCVQVAEVGQKVAYGERLVSPEAFGDKISSDLY